MSENNSPLSELLNNLKTGMGRLGQKAPPRKEPDLGGDNVELLDRESGTGPDLQAEHAQNNQPAQNDSGLLDDIPGEAETIEEKPKSLAERIKALPAKQKLLLCGAVLACVVYGKSQLDAGSVPEQVPPTATQPAQTETELPSIPAAAQEALNAEFKPSVEADDSTGLELPAITPGEQNPDLTVDADLRASPGVTTEISMKPIENYKPESEFPAQQSAGKTEDQITAAPSDQTKLDAVEAPLNEPVDSPFPAPEGPLSTASEEVTSSEPAFGEGTLGGKEILSVDSSTPVPDANTTTAFAEKLAKLEAENKHQAETIQRLEKQIAGLQNAPQVKAPAIKESQAATATQSVAHLKAAAPKMGPRPKLCVKAVAQAARNCSTCVAHAFVVSNGQESMVGHGDKINDFRVAIVGDRLDLQGPSGTEPYKFWTSPNGCAY